MSFSSPRCGANSLKSLSWISGYTLRKRKERGKGRKGGEKEMKGLRKRPQNKFLLTALLCRKFCDCEAVRAVGRVVSRSIV